MKHLIRLTTMLILLSQTIGFSQNKSIETISKKYNSLLKEQNKGVAILIKKNNESNKLSLGNFNLTDKSVFNIGSATKTFTAILILQEVEKGTILLNDSIGKFLTKIKNVDNSLTIKQLLTHESGLDEIIGRNVENIFFAKSDSLYKDNLLYQIEKNNPKMVGKFQYCNTNYFLLGKILENVTDQSYFDLLRERIIEPLQMENTYPYVHKNLPNLATPYHNEKEVTEYLDYKYFANIAYAAGSIASTLSDMETFYISLFETEKLLQKETVKLMMESGNASYGLGLFKSEFKGNKYVGHGGNNIGYAFKNRYNPKTKNLFLLFSNSMAVPSKKSLVTDILSYLNNQKIEDFKEVDFKKFNAYTGTYLLKEANMTLNIVAENNEMFLEVKAQGIKSKLTQKNETTLFDTVVGASLEIIANKTNALKFSQNGFTTTINKVVKK